MEALVLQEARFAGTCSVGSKLELRGALASSGCTSSSLQCSTTSLGRSASKKSLRRHSRTRILCALAEPPSRPACQNPFTSVLERIEKALDSRSRAQVLIQLGRQLPHLEERERIRENQVMGCTAQVWVTANLANDGTITFRGDSDSELSRGLVAILVQSLSGLTPEAVLEVGLDDLGTLGLGPTLQTRSRVNGFQNMLMHMQRVARQYMRVHEGLPPLEPFPSLLIKADGSFSAQGDFAVAQARYLAPDGGAVDDLVQVLESKKIGVVAHFYMDPQVQGVLAMASQRWPHIHISDSLVMADRAARMAADGCTHIAVLGVDFMAENVRAILDREGYSHVPVYRMADEAIGCSLAEAAESPAYLKYLEEASHTPSSLHVIYINTSLHTKAVAQSLLPTITCTSSNVVQTVLQAFAQVPEATVWYGPDTFMGGNLVELLKYVSSLPNQDIAAIHPGHTQKSIAALLHRLHYFQDGDCIVHDLFGSSVVSRTRALYGDAFITAHFEVPGEMFALALEARSRGMGVVGSTSNILDFVGEKVKEALDNPYPQRLRFVLGTEAGMLTSIVGAVKKLLREGGRGGGGGGGGGSEGNGIEVEIVFPVSEDAVARTDQGGPDVALSGLAELAIVPGVATGEGCSITGGCASCPYMKMNSLDALTRVCERIGTPGEALLDRYRPKQWKEPVAGLPVAELGTRTILHMRHFQSKGTLSQELVQEIQEGVQTKVSEMR